MPNNQEVDLLLTKLQFMINDINNDETVTEATWEEEEAEDE